MRRLAKADLSGFIRGKYAEARTAITAKDKLAIGRIMEDVLAEIGSPDALRNYQGKGRVSPLEMDALTTLYLACEMALANIGERRKPLVEGLLNEGKDMA